MTAAVFVARFILIGLAGKLVGEFLARFRLPLITGYLLAGILAGPFVLNIIEAESLESLRFIDEMALAFIAFAAGSELYLKELKSRLKSIAWITGVQLIVTYSLGSLAVLLLSDMIPFMRDMPMISRFAVAIIAGSILVARSPSSAIAIVNELRAKGPFTKMALGVTVVMDVVVIFLFAFSSSVADALLTNIGINVGFVLLLLLELGLSLAAGYGVGKALQLILSTRLDIRLKSALMLLTGLAVFILSTELRDWTHVNLPVEILLEPLLVCMIGSFVVTNFTDHRDQFLQILHDIGPAIYVLFFTLTGASLALDILAAAWPIALILFFVRLGSIYLGSLGGGILAGDPMQYNRLGWMTFITQAGVGLGLAKEVAVSFPQLGDEFSTLIISVIVINQLVGPPFFKTAIKRVGEAHLPGQPHPDDVRDALILGVDDQSLALARQLKAHNWQVIMADTDRSHVERLAAEDIEVHYIPEITVETLRGLVTSATDAIVSMLWDDLESCKACELAYEEFGIPRLIVRLNEMSNSKKLHDIGALVVVPSLAMVNLLDQFVRAPQTAALLMHVDPDHDTVQVTVAEPDIHGLALRDLRLPGDVLVLSIVRDGHSIMPHGYTSLHLDDEVTLVGKAESLEEMILKLGY